MVAAEALSITSPATSDRPRPGVAATLAITAAIVVGAAPSAHASLVRELGPDQLAAGADLIVEGQIVAVESTWNQGHTGFESRIRVRVGTVIKGAPVTSVEILQPGGTVDGARHIIAGMPAFAIGEHARLYLRQHRGAAHSYRVYGWNQGKWPGRMLGGAMLYAPPHLAAADKQAVPPNGLVWRPEQMPVPFLVNHGGNDDVTSGEALGAILASFSTWQAVPCSKLSYNWDGATDLGMAVDDTNVITFIESNWIYGAEAAAAASMFFPVGSTPTADVGFNGENFTWAISPPGAAVPDTQDIQGVFTHELGHFSGLTHGFSAIDTMYYSWRPWQSQRSLSADDKLGLCNIYPQDADECRNDDECPTDESCESYAYGTLCTTHPDPIGAACNRERVECDSFCLFTSYSLATGYCSMFCDEADCPAGFHCDDASAGGQPVLVCFEGDPPSVDAGPSSGCTMVSDCPAGQYCNESGACAYDCIEDFDCDSSDLVCDDHGQCIDGDGGGGCGCHATPASALLLVLILAGLLGRRRARQHL